MITLNNLNFLNNLKLQIENLNQLLDKKQKAINEGQFETAAMLRDEEKAVKTHIKTLLQEASNLDL